MEMSFKLTIMDNDKIVSEKKYKNLLQMSKDSGIKYSILYQLYNRKNQPSKKAPNSIVNRMVGKIYVEDC